MTVSVRIDNRVVGAVRARSWARSWARVHGDVIARTAMFAMQGRTVTGTSWILSAADAVWPSIAPGVLR